jgi:hypothetical protein
VADIQTQRPWGSVALATRHPLSAKFGSNFADKQQSLVCVSSCLWAIINETLELWEVKLFVVIINYVHLQTLHEAFVIDISEHTKRRESAVL